MRRRSTESRRSRRRRREIKSWIAVGSSSLLPFSSSDYQLPLRPLLPLLLLRHSLLTKPRYSLLTNRTGGAEHAQEEYDKAGGKETEGRGKEAEERVERQGKTVEREGEKCQQAERSSSRRSDIGHFRLFLLLFFFFFFCCLALFLRTPVRRCGRIG